MANLLLGTLGPRSSNHCLVAERYLRKRAALPGSILPFASFDMVLNAAVDRQINAILICAAHSDCARVVGQGQFRHNLRLTDTFLAQSRPLAIVARSDTSAPRKIAVQPATAPYADLSDWAEIVPVDTIVAAAEGLVSGAWESALTAPGLLPASGFRVVRSLGAPMDAWLVLTHPDVAASPHLSAV